MQTRSLLSVFEEDAGTLTDYTNQLLQAMQRVYGAQVSSCLCPGVSAVPISLAHWNHHLLVNGRKWLQEMQVGLRSAHVSDVH